MSEDGKFLCGLPNVIWTVITAIPLTKEKVNFAQSTERKKF